jgi:hypothetical protein
MIAPSSIYFPVLAGNYFLRKLYFLRAPEKLKCLLPVLQVTAYKEYPNM